MAQVNKIDSNVVGLRIAEENSIGVLPGTPGWIVYEPNSFNDFGAQLTLLARNPISEGRQRKKGVITDLDVSGGFQSDFTQTNLQDILQGFMFADFRRKGEEIVTAVDEDSTNPDEYEVASTTGFQAGNLIKGSGFANAANNAVNLVTAVVADTSVEVATGQLVTEGSPPSDAKITAVGFQFGDSEVDIDVSSQDLPRLVRASGSVDFTTLGINPGEWIFVGGDAAATAFTGDTNNNGFKRVRQVDTTFIEFDKSVNDMADETGTSLTIQIWFGRVLKNETGTSITRRTYQQERTLGAPDDSSPSDVQAEYLVGCVPNVFTLNIAQADKITADMTFIATDHEQIDGPTSLKSGNRPTLVDSDAFNTSSDFSRIKLSTVSSTDAAPEPLFAFANDISISINNNASPNKAIGVLGAFEITAGTFQVDGNITAYFSNVNAVTAVRNNTDITIDMIVVKNNAGFALDLPLIALGDGQANIEVDQPITLPLTMDAATAAGVDASLDHTAMWVFFDYLPDLADS